MRISYNWLKWYVPEVPEAKKLADLITYHVAEVESVEEFPLRLDKEGAGGGDFIFDIKILPNRAHDLLSHQGLARELSSLLNISYTDPVPKYKVPKSGPTELKIDIQTDKCARYMGRIVRNVKIGSSPDWVVKHLESIGQRSINNAVDAANLVMFDSGQPIHCFDLDKLAEEGLIVHEARKGEEMTTLDNKQLKLKPTDLVIADSKNILGLAGVKGGKIAEVDANTKNIIIEVANFDPAATRKSARGHGLITDAAKRFENEPTPELCKYAMLEISALFAEIGNPERSEGWNFEDIVDVYPAKPKARIIEFTIERISSILGEKISEKDVKNILERYGMDYEEKGGKFLVTIPSHRLDLSMPEDMAEEIGRVLGYDKVKPKLPKINFKPKANEQYEKIKKARERLLSQGYSEVMTYAFQEKGKVEVMESASDKKALRADLSVGLSESLKLNKLNALLLGLKEVKIFEIGAVWLAPASQAGTPQEEIHVAYNEKDKIVERMLDEFSQSNPSQPPLIKGGENIPPDKGDTGGLFKVWSFYPFITRDIALWVPKGVESSKVQKLIKENAGELVVRGPELFDEFKKEEKVSYAFRMVFQSFDRTLTDEEVNGQMERVKGAVEKEGWTVR